jgi:hypothetical protein
MTIRIQKHSMYFALIFVATFAVPLFTHANYTFNGKTFETYADMQEYVVKYMEAWREIYGDTKVKTNSEYGQTTTRATRSTQIEAETLRTRDVTSTSVRFQGELDLKRSERARIWFDYGLSKNTLDSRTETDIITRSNGSDIFDKKAFNLTPNKTYYYRAGAINEDGVAVYGEIRSFKTDVDTSSDSSAVMARTYSPTNVDDTRATLRGSINLKKERVAYTWFEYGDAEDDLFRETPKKIFKKGDVRTVSGTIQRLEEAEEYYYRFLAMDEYGDISYGDVRKFTTRRDILDQKPTAKTLRYESVGIHSATLVGEVDMNDFKDGIVFFVYGEERDDIREVANRYDEYRDIKERGDDRQKKLIDDNFDRYKKLSTTVTDLDENTTHYYAIGVEFENEDGDEELVIGQIYTLRTQRDN